MARISWAQWGRRVKTMACPGKTVAYGWDKNGRPIQAIMPEVIQGLIRNAFTEGQGRANKRIGKQWRAFLDVLDDVRELE